MKTTTEMDAAIEEAKQIRARHDGVHQIHSYVAVMTMCRELVSAGSWAQCLGPMFDEALASVRHVDRTGFAPKPVNPTRAVRVAAVSPAMLAEA